MGPTGSSRVLQIHPTRRCNLSCLHCYSLSGPGQRGEIGVPVLLGALDDARLEGYDYVGFSGGEPLLYGGLADLLQHARELGMRTSITTNGMLLKPSFLDRVQSSTDLIAISLDGIPVSHNRMRGATHAFETMQANLPLLRERGMPFGFIFTLTRGNIAELEWVTGYALEQGARLVQVHLLEEVGRAVMKLPGERPDDTTAGYAFVEAARLQALAGSRLNIHLDLTDIDLIRTDPERVFAGDLPASDQHRRRLADSLSPLVVEADGTVVPVQYGFGRHFALGNLHSDRLSRMAVNWMEGIEQDFRSLCRSVLEEITGASFPLQNWYDLISRRSRGVPSVTYLG